jgi:hypothetical protein
MEALHNPKLRYLIRRATSPDEDTGKGLEAPREPGPDERPGAYPSQDSRGALTEPASLELPLEKL